MTRRLALIAVFGLMEQTGVAWAQQPSVEITQTVGGSTERVAAAGTQLRTFGDLPAGIRFNVEGAWGTRSTDHGDAFGTAYPYDNRVQVIEAYAERTFRPGRALVSVRAGRYRTPFGISSAGDHAYIGYLRPPLVRYDGYYALSNGFLEQGLDVVIGTPALSLELSAGTPADVGQAERRDGLDLVARGQWFRGAFIVGVSYIHTRPYQSPTFAQGHARFGGIDARWMRGGVQIRGEWMAGRPFAGSSTHGGYVDVIVHRPAMGPVTAFGRLERIVYDAEAPFDLTAARYTAGARVRLLPNLSLSAGLAGQTADSPEYRLGTALDVGLTYTLRYD